MASISKKTSAAFPTAAPFTATPWKTSLGAKATIITYGARIQGFQVPDKAGRLTDIILGFDDAKGYEAESFYMGAIVGRHANRIQNAEFTIDGITYHLEQNDGKNGTNSLHSGSTGFHCKLWSTQEQNGKLIMSIHSADGEGGFPGNFTAHVTYELTEDNQLKIGYEATSDADTICNMTNHSYFNLNGCNGSLVLDHDLQIFSDSLTEANDESLPNGKIYTAAGTPMDFQQPAAIGARIDDDFQQLVWGAGYDHNWILTGPEENGLKKAAYAVSPETGISLTVYTDMPGMQFYSGNFLDGTAGKGGVSYPRRSGFCLETQFYPNSPAHPEFPQPLLKKGQTWKSTTIFSAGIAK